MNDLALQAPENNFGGPLQPYDSEMPSLRYMLGVAQSHWKLAFCIGALVFAAIVCAAMLLPRSYYAEASLVIHPMEQNLAVPSNPQSAMPPDSSAVDTEVEILRSPAVAEQVVRKLKLYQDPDFGGAKGAKPTDEAIRRAVAIFQADSRIRRIGLTYAVQIGFVSSSSSKAKEMANAIIDTYLGRKLDQKLADITRANRDLGATLGGLRQQALDAESKVEAYKAKYNLLGVNGTSLTEAELSALNQRIADAQADAAEKEARMHEALAQQRRGSSGADVGATLASGTIGALRQREADLSAKLSQLQTEFKPDYPPVQKTAAELKDVQRQLASETKRILSSLRADAEAAERREASLLASRVQTEQRLTANNAARVGLLTLQQAADSAKRLYETYLTRASEVSAERSLQQVDATVESKAIPMPGSPFASIKFIGAIALLIAAIAALAAIFIAEMWRSTIRSWHDLTRDTGLPLAGTLPDIRALRHAHDPASHIVTHPLTAFAEGFRNLRAFLAFSVKGAGPKLIAVTSAVPGEGKTLVSTCLARSLAATGQRVVLLDCDLRRASASKFFAQPEYGLAEVVTQAAPIDRALTYDADSGLWVLSASTTNIRSGDLFGTDRIDELLERLSKRFDRIVIDTSPLLGFADARILASKADCVLYVVQWDKTPSAMVRAASEILRQCHARVAGAVLNRVNIRQQARYGFADGSDYYHYYSSAYAQA